MRDAQVQSLAGEDPLEEKMATHSSILAWKIPWVTAHRTAKSQARLSEPRTSLVAQQERICLQRRSSKRHGSIPGSGRSPGEGHATRSSILAWRIPWTEEPHGLESMGSQRVRHDWSDLAGMHKWLSTQHKVLKTGLRVRKSIFINNLGNSDSMKERASG